MGLNSKKTAAYLWSLGSILFFIAVVMYVFVLKPSSGTVADKTNQIVNDWFLASAIWRIETIAAALLTVSSWYFATLRQSISWFLISFGHIVMMIMYANMLGSYPAAAEFYSESPHLFPMVNDTAVWVFGISNLLFLTGMTGVYYKSDVLNNYMSWTGTVISLIGALFSLGLFLDLLSFGNLSLAGPLILILYLVNAYLGFKIARE